MSDETRKSEAVSQKRESDGFSGTIFWSLGPLALLHIFLGRPSGMVSTNGLLEVKEIAFWGILALPLAAASIVLLRRRLRVWAETASVSPLRAIAASVAWCMASFLLDLLTGTGHELGSAFVVQFAAVTVLLTDKADGKSLSFGGLASASGKKPLWGASTGAAAAVAAFSTLCAAFFAGEFLLPEKFSYLSFSASQTPVGVDLLFMIVLIPLVEEIIFRAGVIGLLKRWVGNWPAIVLAAALFSALHLQPEIFWARFIAGIFMGWLYARSGSIVPSWTLHAIMNFGIAGLPVLFGS